MSTSSYPEPSLRILVVDDEELACRNLKRKLLAAGETAIDYTTDPAEAVMLLHRAPPDLLLLDIQMPGLTGFDVLAHFPERERRFAVVFCTAHDEYAVQAFEAAALDYLVKPVDPARLSATLTRIRRQCVAQHVAQHVTGNTATSEIERARLAGMTGWLQRVVAHFHGGVEIVSLCDVLVLSSEAHRTVAYTASGEYVLDASLAALEPQLDPSRFLRCHRAHIVQLSQVTAVESTEVVLAGQRRVPLARRCRAALLARLAAIVT